MMAAQWPSAATTLLIAVLIGALIPADGHGTDGTVHHDPESETSSSVTAAFPASELVIDGDRLSDIDRTRALSKQFGRMRRRLVDLHSGGGDESSNVPGDADDDGVLARVLGFIEFYTAPYDPEVDDLARKLPESWQNPFFPVPSAFLNGPEDVTLRSRFRDEFFDHVNEAEPDERLALLRGLFQQLELVDDDVGLVLERCRHAIGRDLAHLAEQGRAYDELRTAMALPDGARHDHLVLDAVLQADQPLSTTNALPLIRYGSADAAKFRTRIYSFLTSPHRRQHGVKCSHLTQLLGSFPEAVADDNVPPVVPNHALHQMEQRWNNRDELISIMQSDDYDLVLMAVLQCALDHVLYRVESSALFELTRRLILGRAYLDVAGYADVLALACPLLGVLFRALLQHGDGVMWYGLLALLADRYAEFRHYRPFTDLVDSVLEWTMPATPTSDVVDARFAYFKEFVLVSPGSPSYDKHLMAYCHTTPDVRSLDKTSLWILFHGLDHDQFQSLIEKISTQIQYLKPRDLGVSTESLFLVQVNLAECAYSTGLVAEMRQSLTARRRELAPNSPLQDYHDYDTELSLLLSLMSYGPDRHRRDNQDELEFIVATLFADLYQRHKAELDKLLKSFKREAVKSLLAPGLERCDLDALKSTDAISDVHVGLRAWALKTLLSGACDDHCLDVLVQWMKDGNHKLMSFYTVYLNGRSPKDFGDKPGVFLYLTCILADDQHTRFSKDECDQILQLEPHRDHLTPTEHGRAVEFLLHAHTLGSEWQRTPLYSGLIASSETWWTWNSIWKKLLDPKTMPSAPDVLRFCGDVVADLANCDPDTALKSVLSISTIPTTSQLLMLQAVLDRLFPDRPFPRNTSLLSHLEVLCLNTPNESTERFLKPILTEFRFHLTPVTARQLIGLIFDNVRLDFQSSLLFDRIFTALGSMHPIEESPNMFERFLAFLDRDDALQTSNDPISFTDEEQKAEFFKTVSSSLGRIDREMASKVCLIIDRLQYLVTGVQTKTEGGQHDRYYVLRNPMPWSAVRDRVMHARASIAEGRGPGPSSLPAEGPAPRPRSNRFPKILFRFFGGPSA